MVFIPATETSLASAPTPFLVPLISSRRGVTAVAGAEDAAEAPDEDENPLEAIDTAAARKKKAKVGALWEQLQQKAGAGGGLKAKPVSLASLTKEVSRNKKSNPDMVSGPLSSVEGDWQAPAH
jgi:hypothetical protein